MSYYDPSFSWAVPGRQPTWEQESGLPQPRSGSSPNTSCEDVVFSAQFEEVDRAHDNLMKSGKMFGVLTPARRDSMPILAGRPYSEFDPRNAPVPQRHHSISEYDGIRSHSASNLQNFYANQRFQPRPIEADQAMQAKRRMAAQRERELRNYHQEQQYNRNVSGAKSDRSMSPNAMSEEDRRDLIARQHRALYGEGTALFGVEGTPQCQGNQDTRVTTTSATTARGPSPLAFDPFGMQGPLNTSDSVVQMPTRDGKDGGARQQRSRSNSTSPTPNATATFSLFDNAQQSSRTSNSSPGGSPPRSGGKIISSGVAPIGTRPVQGQGQPASTSLSKRSTTPASSSLSYAYTAIEHPNSNNEHPNTTSSNPSSSTADKTVTLGWRNSGVWGTSKNTLGVQASVWG